MSAFFFSFGVEVMFLKTNIGEALIMALGMHQVCFQYKTAFSVKKKQHIFHAFAIDFNYFPARSK